MKQIHVTATAHPYVISIGKGIRFRTSDFLTKQYSKILVITDEHVSKLYLDDVLNGLQEEVVYTFTIPSGEKSKGIDMYYQLLTEAMQHRLDRDSLIIALGGGVVGDLSGFVAATYMRGIDYVQIPTTILAHDSSVGGKVAINHELGKNMIGAFYPPQAVIFDVETIKSLSVKETRSGFAELIKEAFIANEAWLDEMLETNIKHISEEQLAHHLYQGIKVKAHIVEIDEKEADIRKFLNFGHTLAHALETEAGYGKLTHGEAVAIGMLFALRLGEKEFGKHKYDALAAWLKSNDYPLTFDMEEQKLITHMKRDKKAHHDVLQFVLLESAGKPIIADMDETEVLQALKKFKKELNTI